MGCHAELPTQILGGRADASVGFDALRALLRHLGFEERTRGSHHVLRRAGVAALINLQRDGDKAEVPGCAAHGPPPSAAVVAAQEAIALWIDTARAFGDAVPEPKGRRLLLA